MADNIPRARGRARGRARATQPQGSGSGPAAPRPGAGPQSAAPRQGESVGRAPRSGQGPPGGLQQHPQQRPPQQAQKYDRGGGVAGAAAAALDPSALAQRLQSVSIQDPSASVGRGTARGRRNVQVELIHTRPTHISSKKGTSGARLIVSANYFKLETHTDWRLYQYRVDFDPETDHTGVKKGLLKVHRETLGGYIFDGSVMFTSHMLTQDPSKPIELFSKRADDVNIRITVRLVGDLAIGDHHYLQFFNILMRKCLQHLKLQLVGRNYFDPRARVEVREHKLELWPGYVTSIRQHENCILMCAEITHKIMRRDTCMDLLMEILQRGEKDYRRAFQQAVIGAIVLTDYNNRTYRVDDVDFEVSPDSTFKLSSGQEISYRQYYKERYQINIKQANQPMLVSRTKAREQRAGMSSLVYLIPELCRMTGLTDDMRNNFHLMKALADHTRVGARARIDKLLNFGHRLTQEKAIFQDFKEWNMKLAQNLIEFEGRALQTEDIIQAGNNSKYTPSGLVDWTRDLRSRPLLVTPNFQTWVVITTGRLKRDTMAFVTTLQKAAGGMRFQIPPPIYQEIGDDRSGSYVAAIENVINNHNPQLIMTVVPNNKSDRYSSIKKKCCVERAVCSQVIVARSLGAKGVMSIATKVAIQIGCKIGGAPWTVEMPLTGLMVVGFDVCHDTTTRGKSFGAMVASLDKSLGRYFSAASPHTTGEELSNDLSVNLTKAVRRYTEYNNGALPARIVIYRDGVGEGQIPYVFQYEVNLIKENLGRLYAQAGAQLKMAFVIVTKRINTRIFVKGDNPPPGTVVDDCITSPERYDFFLVSQTVRQGTVSPTYYNVISDNVGLDPDKMQRLTYKLTHLYYNWSGTVRVPAPCQYAHKLAYLVGQALHRAPTTQLEDNLYFL